ncbi:MAG: ABC transporter permease [Ignavibacteriae bacterium]|nr:ABC transporter permease [Ignavibacteriota bacterium]
MVKRLHPLIIKEFRQIRRDKRSLGVLLVLPAFLVFLIGYALSFDVKHISLVVFDQDKSQMSRDFTRTFSNTEYFDFKYSVESYKEVDRLLDEGKALVAIVIPTDFTRQILSGNDAPVQVLVDGSNANTATTAIGYINGIVQNYSTKLATETLERVGREFYVPIDFRPNVWYNPELVTAKFLVPGMIGFILMITGVVSTSLSVVREKERGTMEQLMISPLHTFEIIFGKVIPYLIIGLIAATFVVSLGFLLFDISVKGSFFWLFVGIMIFLVCALGQGLLISTITRTQQVAFMISVFSSLLPTFLLSGFVFPIRSMPLFLQILSNLAPAKYFLIVIRSIVLKGAGLAAFWDQLVFMGIFATVVISISSLRLIGKAE